jgi:hypothetical protein
MPDYDSRQWNSASTKTCWFSFTILPYERLRVGLKYGRVVQ